MGARKSTPHLLTALQAVEVLTARKSRPTAVRIGSVLDRLADQRARDRVEARVAAYWAPLPARARVRRGPAEPWGAGKQMALFEEAR